MLCMYIRARQFNCQANQGCRSTNAFMDFVEFYLEWSDNCLCLPEQGILRFQNRIIQSTVVQCTQLGPLYASKQPESAQILDPSISLLLCATQSSAPSKASNRTLQNICSDGVWAVYQDTLPQGGPIGEYQSAMFGIPIDPCLHRLIEPILQHVYDFAHQVWPELHFGPINQPRVVYHGSSKANAQTILQNGLQPSYGMLGTAIYYSHFWKARRYAIWSQKYQERIGTVFRVYAFWPNVLFRCFTSELSPLMSMSNICNASSNTLNISVSPSHRCACKTCVSLPKVTSQQLFEADHLQTWSNCAPVVHVWPSFAGDKKAQGCLSNEEYAACSNEYSFIDSCATCSKSKDESVYLPLARSCTID